jgi:cytochrome c2
MPHSLQELVNARYSGELPCDCSWCGVVIRPGDPEYTGPVSHGICELCQARVMGDYEYRHAVREAAATEKAALRKGVA